MSRLAAARTIPVTNAAKQENSRKSLTTLAMMPPVLRHMPMACPDPKHMTIPWPKRGSARQVR
jgi:hypothetical protein